jgi:Ser/Thr protein kinase RdoA (MazF antagonist)
MSKRTLWMLLSGDRAEQTQQLSEILEGYREFNDFNLRELQLIESLRTLRMLNYSAWLARRWSDPAFPHNFPWFNTSRYWEEQVLALREQQYALTEPALDIL